MTLYSVLYRNCRLYPRFASIVAAAYILVGLIVTLCVGIPTHSLGRGLYVAAVVLLLTAIADVVAYLVLLRFYSRLAERLSQALDQFASAAEEVEDDGVDYDERWYEDEEECPDCGQWVYCLECHSEECEGREPDPEIANAVTPLDPPPTPAEEPPLGTVPTAVADISNIVQTATEPEVVVEEVCVCGAPLSYTDKAYLDSHPEERRLCHQCWSQMNHRI